MVLAMPDMLDTPMLSTARGLLMLSLRLMPTMVLMDMVLAMPDMAMVLAMPDMLDTPMPSMARGLLMLSLRLMPTMVLMDMVLAMPDMATVLAMPDMLDTPMLSTERGLLMLSPRLMPTMVVTPMVATPMPTDGASKMSSTPHQSRPPSTNAEAQKQTKFLIKFDIQCLYKSFVI